MEHPISELIDQGYTYEEDGVYSKFTPSDYTTWDEADKEWESLAVGTPWDAFGVSGYWEVKNYKNLTLDDSESSAYSIANFYESLNFIDLTFEPPNVVLSDIELGVEDISFDEFKRRLANVSPVGYEESRPFYPGEYDYKSCLIGLQLRVNASDSRLGIYGAKANVDIEDIVDKGEVFVPEEGVTVEFNKTYYKPPQEILFNLVQYVYPAIIEVVDKSEKSFTIKLKKISDGTYTSGTVSWMSNGY